MSERPAIFVSAVSRELGDHRRAVGDVLLKRGVFPVIQEHFPPDFRTIRELLRDQIGICDAVICLVGWAYGLEPQHRPPDQPRRSYTQLELDIARELRKPAYLFVTTGAVGSLGEVPDESADARDLQLKHRESIIGSDHVWHAFATIDALVKMVAIIPLVQKMEDKISPTRIGRATSHLVGRGEELDLLDRAWREEGTRILTIVAWGGVGKTALISTWAAQRAEADYDGARYFDWSFYSHGTHDQAAATSDAFITRALEFFGDVPTARSSASPWEKGARLAKLVADRRTLLILDGLEPLQFPPGPRAGELRDLALASLLRGLAQRNKGLCVVTTREPLADLVAFRSPTVIEKLLSHLSLPAGLELLEGRGVHGTRDALEALIAEVRGHALTLNLVALYLSKVHGGDIRKIYLVDFAKADAAVQGGHAFKTMAAYERWLSSSGPEGLRQCALILIMGLFDRPVRPKLLAALLAPPGIPSLTEPLSGLGPEELALVASALEECGLLSKTPAEPHSQALLEEGPAFDTHPLIREYAAAQLRSRLPESWREAHRRLYQYLTQHSEGSLPTQEDLAPLFTAVFHGCLAGLYSEACQEVYRDRIHRGEEYYAAKKLGAYGAELGVLASFFARLWNQLHPSLSETDQAWLLGRAAFCLRALGRLAESAEPLRRVLHRTVQQSDWVNAVTRALNLSETELLLGNITDAVTKGRRAVDWADQLPEDVTHQRLGTTFKRIITRTTLADALHHAGRRAEAIAMFEDGKRRQIEHSPKYPYLYSVYGYRYAHCLLAPSERWAWRRVMGWEVSNDSPFRDVLEDDPALSQRVRECTDVRSMGMKVIEGRDSKDPLIDIGVDNLTLARCAVCEFVISAPPLRGNDRPDATELAVERAWIADAVGGVRGSGMLHYLPRALLARSWWRWLESDDVGAREDVDEAWDVAARGSMRVLQSEAALYRARLFRDRQALRFARQLIVGCHYEARLGELQDAEAAAIVW